MTGVENPREYCKAPISPSPSRRTSCPAWRRRAGAPPAHRRWLRMPSAPSPRSANRRRILMAAAQPLRSASRTAQAPLAGRRHPRRRAAARCSAIRPPRQGREQCGRWGGSARCAPARCRNGPRRRRSDRFGSGALSRRSQGVSRRDCLHPRDDRPGWLPNPQSRAGDMIGRDGMHIWCQAGYIAGASSGFGQVGRFSHRLGAVERR